MNPVFQALLRTWWQFKVRTPSLCLHISPEKTTKKMRLLLISLASLLLLFKSGKIKEICLFSIFIINILYLSLAN